MYVEDQNGQYDRQDLLDVGWSGAETVNDRSLTQSSPVLTSHSHRQRRRLLVGSEADNVQTERDRAIHRERNRLVPRHFSRAVQPHPIQLARRPSKKHTLAERKRRHADEQVQGVQFESADLHACRCRTNQPQA